jgi:uncharacterized membrane protein YphA (DoxX/SURF4 family)
VSPSTPSAGLWLAQSLIFASFVTFGCMKMFMPVSQLAAMWVWPGQLPVPFLRFMGLVDAAGGIGVLLPALTRIQPRLTVLAALGCTVLQICAIIFHVSRGEASVTPLNFILLSPARASNESPVLLGKWLEPGMTVVSIGSTLPEQREVAVDVIERARLILADMPEEVAHETGDMLEAKRSGIEFMHKLASLSELIGEQRAAREGPEDIVLYKSVGSALQDVVIAEMLLARARARGIGTVLSASIAPVAK